MRSLLILARQAQSRMVRDLSASLFEYCMLYVATDIFCWEGHGEGSTSTLASDHAKFKLEGYDLD
jgi:hypothetical protein